MSRRIFVFGSNLAGSHGAGAARHAADRYGAEMGVGEGLTGDSYALPTMDGMIRPRRMENIQRSVEKFLLFAATNPDLTFHVTRVGCGIAGFTDEQIAPLFKDAPTNCHFSPEWAQQFGYPVWPIEM